MLAFLATCLFLSAFSSDNGYGQETQAPAHRQLFFLNTDMARFDSPSASFFLDWQTNANALFQLGFDNLSDYLDLHGPGRELDRVVVLTLFTGAGYVVNQAFSITAHDERHMEAARAIGASAVSLVRTSDYQQMSIWEFFFEAFNFTYEPGLYTYTANATLDEQAYVASEGLDTNMLIADMTSRKINEGAGHITDLVPYLLDKLWGINYFLQTGPTSDAGNYMDLLSQKGYAAVTKENIIFLQVASCVVSGGFLSLVRGTYDFMVEGNSLVSPLGLRIGEVSVFWPEVTTWLNSDSVSLRITVDAAWKDVVLIRAGMDSPILGNTAVIPEMTLGAKVRIQKLSLGLELTSHFVNLPLFIASAEYDLSDMFSVGVEGHYGARATMRELREYPLGPGAVGWVKVRF